MPSIAFFLLRSFLRVFLLLLSVYLRFLSEALEFSDGDFCVLTVTALRFATLFFHFYTWYVYFAFAFSLLRFDFVGLLLACLSECLCDWVFCQGFRGFLFPPCILCGLWFFFGRVKGFGMGILVV